MKYVGSKNRISKFLYPIIQDYIVKYNPEYYIEPFVGGANMIDKIVHPYKVGYDNNEYLIELLKQARDNIDSFPDTYDENFYQEVKKYKDEKFEKWLVGLVGFCTFSAKWFGGFPHGAGRDIVNESIRNLKKQSPKLQGILFQRKDFKEIDPEKFSDCLFYCDPPYKGTLQYSKEKFDYDFFYEWCRRLSKNNIVLISEYTMPEDFKCIWSHENTCQVQIGKQQKRIEKYYLL